MRVLGSSPLGLIMDAVDNTKVKLGSHILSTDDSPGKKMHNSLFGRDKDGLSTNKFLYREETEDLYDISTNDIVEYCNKHEMMSLSYSDFAYLKNLGVYPNNRLIIARRFQAPVGDDLVNNDNNITPISTLISWVPDNTDFFDVKFGEKWVDADTSFKELLDDASTNRDIMGGDNKGLPVGTFLAEGAGILPFPGFSEGLQYEVFRALGLTELGPEGLPFGNPNLIRLAKMRAIAPKTGEFSGFKTTISVGMDIEYEQKFIAGIDPTKMYYDILSNVLAFGTSESKFMFRADTLNNEEFRKFLNNLGSGDPARLKKALQSFITALTKALDAVKNLIGAALSKTKEAVIANSPTALGDLITKLAATIVAGVVSKYKVKILGILNALTGSPSAPWHVTIGNPKRPIFSSGDMLVEDVDVKFGKLLAYNDLPSSVKITLTLTNARPLGAQEIFAKLSSGEERSYKNVRLDFVSKYDSISTGEDSGAGAAGAGAAGAGAVGVVSAAAGVNTPNSIIAGTINNAAPNTDPLAAAAAAAGGGTTPVTTGAGAGATAPVNTPAAGSGTNGGSENLENKTQSKSTSPSNPNNPTNLRPNSNVPYSLGAPPGSIAPIPVASSVRVENLSCLKEYNYIVDEVKSIVRLKDAYGVVNGKKVPLLKKHTGLYNDDEELAANELKLAINSIFKSRYDSIKACPTIFATMNKTLNAIYSGIINKKTVQLDYYVLEKSTINNVYVEKTSLNCDL